MGLWDLCGELFHDILWTACFGISFNFIDVIFCVFLVGGPRILLATGQRMQSNCVRVPICGTHKLYSPDITRSDKISNIYSNVASTFHVIGYFSQLLTIACCLMIITFTCPSSARGNAVRNYLCCIREEQVKVILLALNITCILYILSFSKVLDYETEINNKLTNSSKINIASCLALPF